MPREARPYQGRRAGIVSRLLASAVDFVVVVVILAAGYGAVSLVLFLWNPARFHFPAVTRLWVLAAGAGILFCYLSASWVTTGRTWGDLLLGVRVLNHRGDPLRLAVAALRAALCVLFPIGILYAAVSRANRSVADVVLRTSVVYDWGGQPLPSATASSRTDDAPKTDVAGGGVHALRRPRRRTVTQAVAGRAQV